MIDLFRPLADGCGHAGGAVTDYGHGHRRRQPRGTNRPHGFGKRVGLERQDVQSITNDNITRAPFFKVAPTSQHAYNLDLRCVLHQHLQAQSAKQVSNPESAMKGFGRHSINAYINASINASIHGWGPGTSTSRPSNPWATTSRPATS